MAGHSQFKNIMHRKGRQDAVRSKMFSKLGREITVAAKQGLPDPLMNPRLRLAIQNAKAQSMPKDNIERAIKKAAGNDGENYDEVRYEGRGPGGVMVIVEALTDNRNRTASMCVQLSPSRVALWVKPVLQPSCSIALAKSFTRFLLAMPTRSWKRLLKPVPMTFSRAKKSM